MKAAMFGHDLLLAGSADVVVAGGQESMSNAPYLLLRGRQGYRYGHSTVYDHMALDGLETPTSAARPWVCLRKAVSRNTPSPVKSKTLTRWNRCAVPAPPAKTAASTGKSPP